MQLDHQSYHRLILGPLDAVVQQMERDGVCVSLPRLAQIEREANAAVEQHTEELRTWTRLHGVEEVNWSSSQQVKAFLHDSLGLPKSPVMAKGQVKPGECSVDDRALEWLIDHAHGARKVHRPGLQLIRETRRAKRMANYAKEWSRMAVDHGPYATLHPSFGLASDSDTRPGAKTGRFAVKKPALNQVPSNAEKDRFGLRTAFIAPPGYVVLACDASQLEVVLLADKACRLFGTHIMADHLAHEDLHISTAKYIFGELLGDELAKSTSPRDFKKHPHTKLLRQQSKALRYGAHYLKSAFGFGNSLFDANGDPIGEELGQRLIEGLYGFEPELRMLHEYGEWWTRNMGYASSALGRWTWLTGWDSSWKGAFMKARRREANWYAQSTGQEILALALVASAKDPLLRGMGFRPMLPVHDEIVAIAREAHAEEATARLSSHIVGAMELRAPLEASGGWGPNWHIAGGK